MKKFKTTRKSARQRKTPYIFINGVRATTNDVLLIWKNFKAGKEKLHLTVDEKGDIQMTSEE